jgi:ankyrin repeat protein
MIKKYNEYINEKLSDKLSGFNKKGIDQQLINQQISLEKYTEICAENELIPSLNAIHDYLYEKYKNNPNELLSDASKYDFLDLVKIAINNNADVNYANSNPIYNSIKYNNADIFKYLIEQGAKVDSPYAENYFANTAIERNNLEILKILIEKDKSIILYKLLYDTITIYHNIDITKYLLKTLDIRRINADDMIKDLINDNEIKMLEFILEQNILISEEINKFVNSKSFINKEIQLLINHYYEKQQSINEANFADLLNPIEHTTRSLKHELPTDMLIRAAKEGNFHYVNKAIELGADIHAKHDYALFTACDNNNINCIKILIDNGADIHVADDYILRWNCRVGNTDVVKMLLKYDADPLVNDYEPLKVAIKYNNEEIVKILLSTNKYEINDVFNAIYKEIDDESDYKFLLLEYKYKHK